MRMIEGMEMKAREIKRHENEGEGDKKSWK